MWQFFSVVAYSLLSSRILYFFLRPVLSLKYASNFHFPSFTVRIQFSIHKIPFDATVLQRYTVNVINYNTNCRMQNGLERNVILTDAIRLFGCFLELQNIFNVYKSVIRIWIYGFYILIVHIFLWNFRTFRIFYSFWNFLFSFILAIFDKILKIIEKYNHLFFIKCLISQQPINRISPALFTLTYFCLNLLKHSLHTIIYFSSWGKFMSFRISTMDNRQCITVKRPRCI